jgi:hypothetical protein
MNTVLTGGARMATAEKVNPLDAEDELFVETKMRNAPAAKATDDSAPWKEDSDDDTMSYFSSLADD